MSAAVARATRLSARIPGLPEFFWEHVGDGVNAWRARQCAWGGPVLKILIEIYGYGEHVRMHTEPVLLAVCRSRSGLNLDAPESRVGFGKSDAYFPCFVSTPDDFALRATACFGEHQPDLPA